MTGILGVIGTSMLEHESRVPIHPKDVSALPYGTRSHLVFERGYGTRFDVDDLEFERLTGRRPLAREEILNDCGTVLVTKPTVGDLEVMRPGGRVCGWVHSVEQESMAQVAIDRKLTLVAWENMYRHDREGSVHVFARNNELAGYCAVQHALELVGKDGGYGPRMSAAVIGYGSVSRGAITALQGHGFRDVTVYTRRSPAQVRNRMFATRYSSITRNTAGAYEVRRDGEAAASFVQELTRYDVIVNGTLQDQAKPSMFLEDQDIKRFSRECLIIDVSCSKGMGFSFATPTTFDDPIVRIGPIRYYAVDHTPSLLWDSASAIISEAITPFLADLIASRPNIVIDQAMDIREGRILNQDIIDFQHRSRTFPYLIDAGR